ncbi:cellulase family glycosylhydrolase [Pseudomonas sp. NPDC007930]|uniref:glycoside hydrolase family 5 protein n=1 Tax=Pseudomonas sp. NPDC007930 TaxID=3364417 RepID=UPI0036EF1D88
MPLRPATLAGLLLLFSAGGALAASDKIPMVLLNVSGAEFSEGVFPGSVGTNYFFPQEGFFLAWKGRGIRSVRFPMVWERLQPTLNGPLDPTYAGLVDKMLVQAASAGVTVILDIHNYGRYRGQVIGTSGVPVSAYKDLISKVAQRWYGYSALEGYDLMNEPHDDSDAMWLGAAQAGIDAVRAIDKKHKIIIEGRSWASAARWQTSSAELASLKDPQNNLIYSAHLYLDPDASGQYVYPINSATWNDNIGVQRATPFIEWLKANGKKGQIGEHGVPDNDPRWLAATAKLLTYLRNNCVPLAYWSSGPYWGDYSLAIEPTNGVARPQWAVLQKYLTYSKCTANGP